VPVTFNKTSTFIKMIAGLEINGRHEIVYLPRGTDEGVIILNEDLTQASKWMADQCDAEDHESAAFRDLSTCGMGWTESRLDYEIEADGMYAEEQIDPLDMYWDRAARKKNLSDAQRVARVRKMRLEDARALAEALGVEDFTDSDLDASWAIGVDQKAVKPAEEIRLKTGHGNAYQEGINGADPNSEVHIVQFQWWEREPYYRIAHPATGEEMEMHPDEFKALNAEAVARNIKLTYARQVRKVYKQAFVGGRVLSVGPIADAHGESLDRFTLQCMTGELHRSKGTFFGLVRLMKDPQMWSNKLFSQVMHILNTTAKGGILAEKGAFPDIREAQRTFARPDAITIVEDRAIQDGRIMQKPGVGLAAPFISLMDRTDRIMYDCTGINVELMGMRDAQQPGILEAQRKQAGMTILATLFDARKTYLKNVGRIRMHYIQKFLSDGRLMRVAGNDGMFAKRLIRDRVAGKHDVEVSDAPTSPDVKSQTWAMLTQLLPFFKGNMTPTVAGIFLDNSPLPSKTVQQLKTAMAAPNPGAQEREAIGKAQAASKIDSERARAEQARASARRDDAASARDIANAILDLAQASGHAAAAQADQAEAMLMNWLAQTTGQRMDVGHEPYAVVPEQGMGGPAPGQLPTLPVFGQAPARRAAPQPSLSPKMQAIVASLSQARAGAAQPAANPPTMQ
ncbi:MAG: hypothetical protein JSS20_16580, partial [Proteobacteria bacterium]|nr:hypothetical protein [Pseudomonadota bacterium]